MEVIFANPSKLQRHKISDAHLEGIKECNDAVQNFANIRRAYNQEIKEVRKKFQPLLEDSLDAIKVAASSVNL